MLINISLKKRWIGPSRSISPSHQSNLIPFTIDLGFHSSMDCSPPPHKKLKLRLSYDSPNEQSKTTTSTSSSPRSISSFIESIDQEQECHGNKSLSCFDKVTNRSVHFYLIFTILWFSFIHSFFCSVEFVDGH